MLYILTATYGFGQEQDNLILHDSDKIVCVSCFPYYIFEDSTSEVSIDQLLNNPSLFSSTTDLLPDNKNRASTYWFKFQIVDSSSSNFHWIYELYNHRIDSLEIFIVYNNKIIANSIGGDHYLFDTKSIPHKNFAFQFPSIKNDTVFYYIKGKSKLKMDFYSVFKRSDFFIQYANSEYYLLGMLYGILTILLLYNFIYLIIFREHLYFYYLLSIIGFIVYFMTKDGTGFQYLWYNYPSLNDLLPSISICFAMINLLLFTKIFFQKDFNSNPLSYFFYSILFIRLAYLAIEIVANGKLIHLMVVDIPLVLFILWISIKNIRKNELGTYYFPLGVFLFLIGFGSTALYETNLTILPYSTLIIYGSNIGVVAQISAFWASLSYRHRQIMVDQKTSDYNLQLKNIEFDFLQKYKRELEIAVHEATINKALQGVFYYS